MNAVIQGRKHATFKVSGLATAAQVTTAADYASVTIKNQSTSPLKVYACLVADIADAKMIDIIAPATAQDQGDGGALSIGNFTGPIAVAGNNIRYTVAAE